MEFGTSPAVDNAQLVENRIRRTLPNRWSLRKSVRRRYATIPEFNLHADNGRGQVRRLFQAAISCSIPPRDP